MRNLFLTLLAFRVFCSCTHVPKPQPVQAPVKDTGVSAAPQPVNIKPKGTLVLNKTIESIVSDLNNDGQADTISLRQDTANNDGSWYNAVCISIAGHKKQIFKSDDFWGILDTIILKKKVNAVQSNWVFLYKDATQTMLLLSGSVGGFDSGKSSVIQIRDDRAKIVFNKAWDFTSELLDIDNDGVVEIACKSHSEMYEWKGIQVSTYDPYYVYSLDKESKLNIPLTQKYNEEHYVWAGLKNPDEVKVLYPKDGGKPRIVK